MGCGGSEQEGEAGRSVEGGLERSHERGPVKVVLRLDNPKPTIADRITLQMEMISEESYEITPPAFGEKLEQFGIVDFTSTQPELLEGGKLRRTRTYVLEPFLSGEYVIPAMTFRFRKTGEGDEDGHELETEPLAVAVRSLLPDEAEQLEIREIVAPVELERPAPRWLVPLGGTLGVLALIALVMFLVRRRKDGPPPAPRIPAHETAIAALRKLVDEDLPGQGRIKEFYQQISDILRHYIEERFGLRAPERTTEEFLAELGRGSVLDAAHQPLLARFLEHCDLVKFAEHQPDDDDIQRTFDSCKTFIMETRETGSDQR